MTGIGLLPRLAVVLDFGAASPLSILASARGLADVVFICDRDLPYVRPLVGDLADLAAVCDVTGLADEQILAQPECADLQGVVTFSERQLRRTAALAGRRALTFLDHDAARAVTDKFTQRLLLARAGVQDTRCRIIRGPRDLDAALVHVGLPAVLKPRQGSASARTCVVTSVQDAADRLAEFGRQPATSGDDEFVVEQMLPGDPTVAGDGWADYVSVESVSSHGQSRHVAITGKFPLAPPLRETGYVVPSTLSAAWQQEVFALTGRALTALGVRHGVTHTEVKLTPDGPQVIEVNGRVGGYVADLLRRATGFDLIRAALSTALGQPCDVPTLVYRRHAFQYFLTPPAGAVRVRRLDGVQELTQHRGIHLVEVYKHVGDPLDWRDGTLTYLGIVHGSARDHQEVHRLVALIHRTTHIEYLSVEQDNNRNSC